MGDYEDMLNSYSGFTKEEAEKVSCALQWGVLTGVTKNVKTVESSKARKKRLIHEIALETLKKGGHING
jgi:hypothetical protein